MRPPSVSVVVWAMAVGAALGACALWRGAIKVPGRYNPWAELDVDASPNWLTSLKLRRAQSSPLACLAALDRTGIAYERVPDRVTGPGCGFQDAVRAADALDISGFVAQDGRRIRVERDWKGGAAPADTAPAAFLRDVHSAGCRFFSGVLGPDYNAVHRNHFHLEAGGWRMCT